MELHTKMARQRDDKWADVDCPPFRTTSGHRLYPALYLNGFGATRGSGVDVTIGCIPGPKDSELDWPIPEHEGTTKI